MPERPSRSGADPLKVKAFAVLLAIHMPVLAALWFARDALADARPGAGALAALLGLSLLLAAELALLLVTRRLIEARRVGAAMSEAVADMLPFVAAACAMQLWGPNPAFSDVKGWVVDVSVFLLAYWLMSAAARRLLLPDRAEPDAGGKA